MSITSSRACNTNGESKLDKWSDFCTILCAFKMVLILKRKTKIVTLPMRGYFYWLEFHRLLHLHRRSIDMVKSRMISLDLSSPPHHHFQLVYSTRLLANRSTNDLSVQGSKWNSISLSNMLKMVKTAWTTVS